MSNFCENCGQRITPAHAFCEECGARIFVEKDSDEQLDAMSDEMPWALFNPEPNADLIQQSIAASQAARICGLILTNGANFQEKTKLEKPMFRREIAGHLRFLRSRGICYHIVDLGCNNLATSSKDEWKSCVRTLAVAVNSFEQQCGVHPHGVLILGGDDIVPMPSCTNKAGDPDADIETDLPFSTLNTSDPWNTGSQGLRPILAVGRIPVPDDDAIPALRAHFRNVRQALTNPIANQKSFGLSAKQWNRASNEVFGDLFARTVETSPDVSLENVKSLFPREALFHYFNLHGSSEAPYWYGQEGRSYPTAFAPSIIQEADSLNVIGVEACYGARFINLQKSESLLLSALATKTLAFVGSSRIAFGPAAPPIGLADVVIHRFLREMKSGATAGDALNTGRNAILDNPDLEPTGIKTVLEFNLFGDPLIGLQSAEPCKQNRPLAKRQIRTSDQDSRMTMPDVLSLTRVEVDSARQRIRAIIDQHVYRKYPVLTGAQPELAKVVIGVNRHELTRCIYHHAGKPVGLTVMIYAENDGNIAHELVSK